MVRFNFSGTVAPAQVRRTPSCGRCSYSLLIPEQSRPIISYRPQQDVVDLVQEVIVRVACAYCGAIVHEAELGPYQLCAGCFLLLEDELTVAAMRVGRVGRHDAETVVDIPLPVLPPTALRVGSGRARSG